MRDELKKIAYLFSFFILAVMVVSGVLAVSIMRDVYVNEIRTVQNLAGSVLTEYPEAEALFAKALRDMDRETMEAGAPILEKYGYDEQERIEENVSYVHLRTRLWIAFAAFGGLCVLGVHACLRTVARRQEQQEEQVLAILEKYLSEDYCPLMEDGHIELLANPHFADVLQKLGNSLKLKTDWLREERDHTKELVTDISHQLKTPISALKVCFPLYEDAVEASEKEEFQARCIAQIEKLELLADSLVNISHLETQIFQLQPQAVFVEDILTESANTIYHKALKKQVSIETDELSSGHFSLSLDKKWTVEAVANVLDNAVKYSPPEGRIMIRVQKLYSFIRIEIEDGGIGIPEKEKNRIFQRFYRGSSEAVKKEEGVGVGLYLSRKILEEQGGAIFVRPAKEKGSVFIIQLPYVP